MIPSAMIPSSDERDALFKAFARALFKRDMPALYEAVAPDFVWSYHDGVSTTEIMADRAAISAHLAAKDEFYAARRFHEVVYHHLPEVSFMTFRVSETVRATGDIREQVGIERYTFKDGKIAIKDVYRKPL